MLIDPAKVILAFTSAAVMGLFAWIAINVNEQQILLAEVRIELKNIGTTQAEMKKANTDNSLVHLKLDRRLTVVEQKVTK